MLCPFADCKCQTVYFFRPDEKFPSCTPYMSEDSLVNDIKSQLQAIAHKRGILFFLAAPKLWNNLPSGIQQINKIDIFKRCLRTYLFKKAFLIDK